MDKNKRIKLDDMIKLEPLTQSQGEATLEYDQGNNLILSGSAGTGKSFLALYKALEQVLDKNMPCDKVYIVRSIVPTRDIGFLPGDEREKLLAYEPPYVQLCKDIFGRGDAWKILNTTDKIELVSTSYIRGLTLADSIIVVDECQNLTFHELDSVITRLGRNSRIIFSGDYYQSDFKYTREKDGILQFLKILEQLKRFTVVNFTWEDIVRHDLVRDYIMTKELMAQNGQLKNAETR